MRWLTMLAAESPGVTSLGARQPLNEVAWLTSAAQACPSLAERRCATRTPLWTWLDVAGAHGLIASWLQLPVTGLQLSVVHASPSSQLALAPAAGVPAAPDRWAGVVRARVGVVATYCPCYNFLYTRT
jgi:hypothetical protein